MAARDPARRHLRFEDWPASDRAAWDALFVEGDVFEGAGPARHWAAATRRTNGRHYARWLGWLALCDGLDPAAAPGARATPEAVRDFARRLGAEVSPRTAASALIGLKVVLKAMHPEEGWRWLMDLTNRMHLLAEPSRDRGAGVRPIEEIHAASARELDRLSVTPLTRRLDRVAYRDMLIVLTLSAAPVRLRNLASIEIGRHLIRAGGRTGLRFAQDETKNRRRLRFDLPRHVEPHLALYLERIRPSFGPEPGCRRLWLGFEGRPLTAHAIYGRVVLATERLFGTPINPHAFRACAATSFALRSPAMARQAAPLLGHRDVRTTEKHYVKASQIEASRGVNAVLKELRDEQRKGKKAGGSS